MTYENIKSVILTILVSISAFLTWNLWTYQPTYETMKNTNIVQEVALSSRKSMSTIVKPDKIYQHIRGKHYGTISNTEIERIMDQIGEWDYSNFKAMNLGTRNFLNTVHRNHAIEIVFPERVSTDLYRNFLGIKENELESFKFDRIVIDLSNYEKDMGQVFFVAYDEKMVYQSTVSATFIHHLANKVENSVQDNPSYQLYFPYKVSNIKVIFLPESETKMAKYKYYSVDLALEKFKNALFSDPSVVQRNLLPTGEEYTDGSSLLRINYDTSLITFFNPVGDSNGDNTEQLLQSSVDFVNQHGGWTDNYRFVDLDEENEEVRFRLYDQIGYPIFNEENKISEIQLSWRNNEVNKYLRSNFMLKLQTETTDVYLSSGYSAIEYVQNMDNFNPKYLQDIVLGYQMSKDSQDIIHLQPTWYYQYNNRWYPIVFDGTGRG